MGFRRNILKGSIERVLGISNTILEFSCSDRWRFDIPDRECSLTTSPHVNLPGPRPLLAPSDTYVRPAASVKDRKARTLLQEPYHRMCIQQKILHGHAFKADCSEGMQQIRFIRTCEGSYVAYASDVNLACRAPSRREAFQTLRRFLALGRPALSENGERRLGRCVVFRPEKGGYHPSMEQVTQSGPANIHTRNSV